MKGMLLFFTFLLTSLFYQSTHAQDQFPISGLYKVNIGGFVDCSFKVTGYFTLAISVPNKTATVTMNVTESANLGGCEDAVLTSDDRFKEKQIIPLVIAGDAISGKLKFDLNDNQANAGSTAVCCGYLELLLTGTLSTVNGKSVLSGTLATDYSHFGGNSGVGTDAFDFQASGQTTGDFSVTVEQVQSVSYPTPALASASFVEPNNSPELASPILVNDTPVQQLLDSEDAEDWFEFYANVGKHYTIEIPVSSIGKRINPALQLFNKAGSSITNVVTRTTLGQGLIIQFTAPSTDLYRIRVTNQTPFSKIADVDNGYQLRIYLTDAPQQGLVKGMVINSCDQQGVNKAEVAALLGNGVTDSTLTHKTGEFGLLLNPNQYQLKSSATNFQDTQQTISVNQLENNLLQVNQSPNVSCKDFISVVPDSVLQQQRAVAVYDDKSGLLIIRDVLAGSDVYYAELQNLGDLKFQLTRAQKIPSTLHALPGEYSFYSLVVKLPAVFALGRTWNVQMQNDGTYVFSVTVADPK